MNGINAVFMVESVMAVSRSAKIKKENKNPSGFGKKKDGDNELFSEILGTAADSVREEKTKAPTEFKSTVYGKDMKLTSMQYQTREYHY